MGDFLSRTKPPFYVDAARAQKAIEALNRHPCRDKTHALQLISRKYESQFQGDVELADIIFWYAFHVDVSRLSTTSLTKRYGFRFTECVPEITKTKGKYRANYRFRGTRLFLGVFTTKGEAIAAQNHAANDPAYCETLLQRLTAKREAKRNRPVGVRQRYGRYFAHYRNKHIGVFKSEEEAVAARDKFIKENSN